MEELDRRALGHSGAEMRQEERVPYRMSRGLVVTLEHPGGSVANYLVRPRNLSPRGVGFLHGNFVHVGSRCKLHLLRLDGTPQVISGAVVRCQHVTGLVHEIGVRLGQAIAMDEFIQTCDETEEQLDQSVELPKLSAKVLYIDPSVEDQQLLKFHLANLGAEVTVASEPLRALELVQSEPFDLLLVEMQLTGMDGLELVELLRGEGYAQPVLAVTSDRTGSVRQGAIERGCLDVLHKPLTLEQVVRALQQYLSALREAPTGKNDCLISTAWGDQQMRPQILHFLGRMEEQVRQLAEFVRMPEAAAFVQKLAPRLAASANEHGYPSIGRLASELSVLAKGGTCTEEVQRTCDKLVELSHQACAVIRQA